MRFLLAPIRGIARAGLRSIMVSACDRELVVAVGAIMENRGRRLAFRSWRSSRYRPIGNGPVASGSPVSSSKISCLCSLYVLYSFRCPSPKQERCTLPQPSGFRPREDLPAGLACRAAPRTRGRPAGGNSPWIFLHASARVVAGKICRRTRPRSRRRWTRNPLARRELAERPDVSVLSSVTNRLHMSAPAVVNARSQAQSGAFEGDAEPSIGLQLAPQIIENARFAPRIGGGPDASEETARSRGASCKPHSARPEMAPQVFEKARSAPGNGRCDRTRCRCVPGLGRARRAAGALARKWRRKSLKTLDSRARIPCFRLF